MSSSDYYLVHGPDSPCPTCGRTNRKCKQPTEGFLWCRRPGDFLGQEVNGWEYAGDCEKNPNFHYWRQVGAETGRPLTPEEKAEREERQEADNAMRLEYLWDDTEELPVVAETDRLSHRTLSKELGIPCKHLDEFMPRRAKEAPVYAFPWRDGEGMVIGLHCRWVGGHKESRVRNGIIIPQGTQERLSYRRTARQTLEFRETGEADVVPGQIHPTLYIPEGVSDTIAARDMGLEAIGRFSNLGGGSMIAEWLQNHNPDFGDLWPDRGGNLSCHVVLGENDYDPRKPEKGWPGRDGAIRTAHQLANDLGRPVLAVMPPVEYKGKKTKDLRQFLQAVLTRGKSEDRTPGRAGILLEAHVARLARDHQGTRAWLIRPGDPLPTPELPGQAKITPPPIVVAAVLSTLTLPEPDHYLPGPTPDYTHSPSRTHGPTKAELYSAGFHSADWPAEIEAAGAAYHSRRTDSLRNPCENPTIIGLEHLATGNPLEVTKRCGHCEGCQRHKLEVNLGVIRAFLGSAQAAGAVLHEACIGPEDWDRYRRRYHDAADHPGKGYFVFRAEGQDGEADRLYLVSTVPTMGSPVSPGSDPAEVLGLVLAEATPILEAAIRRGGRPYSSSRSWEKDELPRKPTEFRVRATNLDRIDQDYRQRILDDVGATDHRRAAPEGHEDTLEWRLTTKAEGWDDRSSDRYWHWRLYGNPDAVLEVTYTRPESQPAYHPDPVSAPQGGWSDDEGQYADVWTPGW